MQKLNNPIIIGVGGYARAGKDTFVKVARKILTENGYTSQQKAFANALKSDIDSWLIEKYGISAWTDNTEEKKIIRSFLVAHGCGKREQTQGKYWIDKIDNEINFDMDGYSHSGITTNKHVIFISDCRFPNEVDWVHNKWGGWLIHLKKYTQVPYEIAYNGGKIYDQSPNDEEAKNDPICEKNADYRLELENVIEREYRLNNIKITTDDLMENAYLNEEIKKCLKECPLLTIK
jgi:hypothetical protein